LAASIEKAFPQAEVTLEPGSRGAFEVVVDGRQIWDKHSTGRFPQSDEILDALRSRTP
jgi:selT/selW/selH-like putative selenoprotein